MSESSQALVEQGRLIGGPLSRDAAPAAAAGCAKRTRTFETAIFGAGYLIAYAVLDWISTNEHSLLANYAWSPNSGASFVAVLIFGARMLPFIFIAPLIDSFLVPQYHQPPLPFELLSIVLIGSIYGAAALFLLHPKRGFDRTLQSMSSLIALTFTVVASTVLVTTSYIVLMIAGGLMQAEDIIPAAASYWVGDMIGIMVVTPFALILWSRRYAVWLSADTALQLAAIIAAIVAAYLYWTTEHIAFFYVLFVPIVWMAVRTGIEGVCLGILTAQVCFIVGFQLFPAEIAEMPQTQALMLVLAFTGLFAGSLVTERRRTEAVLRLHQESLARLARLGSVGELAAAVAHELNQPLMAAGIYTRLVDDAIRTGAGNSDAVAETAKKAAAQVERAVAVVRRLRALVRLDRTNRVACRVDRIVRETIDLCQPDLDRASVKVTASVAPGLPLVMVDMLQVEQALLNLVRNSIDAIGSGKMSGQDGTIAIEASLRDDDFIEVVVRDSGPGFAPDRAANPFLPLSSTKKEGLGVGLSLSRSLIEAHGGRIWLDADAPGAAMHFTLPVAPAAIPRFDIP